MRYHGLSTTVTSTNQLRVVLFSCGYQRFRQVPCDFPVFSLPKIGTVSSWILNIYWYWYPLCHFVSLRPALSGLPEPNDGGFVGVVSVWSLALRSASEGVECRDVFLRSRSQGSRWKAWGLFCCPYQSMFPHVQTRMNRSLRCLIG